MIAAGAGALLLGLLMAAGGDPTPLPATPLPTTTPAGATPSTSSIVAVRRPPPGDAVLEETASRILSELSAMGLEGQFVDCPPGAPGDSPACADGAAPATIALTRDQGVVEIGVRTILPDGLELRRHVRVVARDGGEDPSVLAVRAVELLRDLRLTRQRPPRPRPVGPAWDDEDPKIPLPPPPPPVPPPWRVSTGAAVLASPASNQPGVGPAFGLAISAGAVVGPRLLFIAQLAGPFNASISAPNTVSSTTTGRLVQMLATLELRFKFADGPVQPFGAVLTGVNYLETTFDTSSSAWVPMFGLGAGISWSVWKRSYLCFEGAAFVTTPDMLVVVYPQGGDREVVARTGAPSVLLSASVGVALP